MKDIFKLLINKTVFLRDSAFFKTNVIIRFMFRPFWQHKSVTRQYVVNIMTYYKSGLCLHLNLFKQGTSGIDVSFKKWSKPKKICDVDF